MIPLEERVCFQLFSAGVLGPDGEKPRCIGDTCSQWESCLYDVLINSQAIERSHRHKKVVAGKTFVSVPLKQHDR